jgi:hypothetical protein
MACNLPVPAGDSDATQPAICPVSKPTAPTPTTPFHGIDTCLELHEKTEDMQKELATLEQGMTDIDKDYDTQRANLRKFIVHELTHSYNEKRKKLLEQLGMEQSKDEQEYMSQYNKHKSDQDEKRRALAQQYELKEQEKKVLEAEAKRKFMEVPKDELLNYIFAQNKQKKRKMAGEKAGHDDKL